MKKVVFTLKKVGFRLLLNEPEILADEAGSTSKLFFDTK